MSNYLSFLNRIAKVSSLSDIDKLEQSLIRVWNAGAVMSKEEFLRIDTALCNLRIKFEELS